MPKFLTKSHHSYLEDLRKYIKELKKAKPPKGSKSERKKEQKRIKLRRQHLKVLVKYIDKDYADTKKTWVHLTKCWVPVAGVLTVNLDSTPCSRMA